jgi:hypothetical protein
MHMGTPAARATAKEAYRIMGAWRDIVVGETC